MVMTSASEEMEVRPCEDIMISPPRLTGHLRALTTLTSGAEGSEHVLSEGVIAVTPTFNGPIILFYISISRSRDQFERFVTFW